MNKMRIGRYKITLDEYYAYCGIMFGYPACCIKEFLESPRNEKTIQKRFEAGAGTGFVPCARHADVVNSGEKKLRQIIRGRKHCSPFPQDDFFLIVEEKKWMSKNYPKYKDRIDKIIQSIKPKTVHANKRAKTAPL